MILDNLDEKKIFTYFEEISQIPRGSKNNKQISDYLIAFAKKHGLSYEQDEALNVVIRKQASSGYENAPSVMLQGHMDMVCEKNYGVDHDFLTEGLHLKIDRDSIYAEGTTLGGDDGIAIAYALSILEDTTLKHPRLEVVITTDEEIGMDGARYLDCKTLTSKYLLNLDSEEEGIVLTSCAGGMTSTCTLPLAYEKKTGSKLDIEIRGLLGGHSGTEIDKNRTNAVLLLGRLLHDLEEKMPYQLLSIEGGLKDNAIPREAKATIVVEENTAQDVICFLEKLGKQYQTEIEYSDSNLDIQIKHDCDGEFCVLKEESKRNILFQLLFTPNGIQVMSSVVEGLVESSLNLGILAIQETQISFSYSVRSSVDSYLDFMGKKLRILIESLGGIYQEQGRYPAWEYQKDSKLRGICTNIYQEMFGKEMKMEAIHAGLECGIISGKMPEIDIIAIGPDIFDIHTPKERLSIASAKRVYRLVIAILEKLL